MPIVVMDGNGTVAGDVERQLCDDVERAAVEATALVIRLLRPSLGERRAIARLWAKVYRAALEGRGEIRRAAFNRRLLS